jgi:alpha-amylase
MMEWALPTPVRQKFHALQQEFANRPDVRRFLRCGFWRGFFSKYAEANLLHKKMLRVSSKLQSISRKSAKGAETRAKATTHVLRAQCNDAYWHGIFGGLYAPHLRTALWRELIIAETMADAARHSAVKYRVAERLDFDADGMEEIEIVSPQFAAVVKPSGGGTLEVLDFRPSAVTLINSLQRRLEAYHARISAAAAVGGGQVASIHEQTLAKQEGLEERLRYDHWPRNTFRLLLFADGKIHEDYEGVRLEENAVFAGGNYRTEKVERDQVTLSIEGALDAAMASGGQCSKLRAAKAMTFTSAKGSCDARCRLELARCGSETLAAENASPLQFMAGLEIVLNLLAPNVPDRYFEFAGKREALAWSGVVEGSRLRVVDEWQNVAVTIDAPGASHLWIAPIETVSESEEGFERVYQGSQILAIWPVQLMPAGKWSAEIVLHVTTAREKTMKGAN